MPSAPILTPKETSRRGGMVSCFVKKTYRFPVFGILQNRTENAGTTILTPASHDTKNRKGT